MISTVLVPLDGSPLAEHAVPYAEALAAEDGRFVAFGVVPERDPLLSELLWALEAPVAPAGDAELAVARQTLEAAVARLAAKPERWSVGVARGDAAEQILHAIEERDADLVVMTTHGRGALGRAVYGSVADRIARFSPVPVLLVRPGPDAEAEPAADIARLVLPLDGSDLAEAALPLAVELAKRRGVPVHLVRAVGLASALAPFAYGGVLAVSAPSEVYEQVAEGIENQSQLQMLRNQGCDAVQAIISCPPLSAEACTDWLRQAACRG